MFLLRKSQTTQRRKSQRTRTLRVESLDRREMMDGYGLILDMPDSQGLKGEGEPPAQFGTQSLTILNPGTVRNESISRVGEVDRFSIRATAGQVFQLAIAPSSPLYGHIRVIEPSGRLLVNTSSTGAVAPIFTANTAGNYIVEVLGRNGQSAGAYRLGLESLSTPSGDAKSLATGSVADGALTGTIQVDQYKVTAMAGQRFQVAMATVAGMNATLRAYEPGGRLIINTSSSGSVSPHFTAAKAGTYIIQVQAKNLTSLGGYRLGVESLSQPSADAKAMAIGSVVNAALSGTVQVDQHKVTAVAGQRFQVALATVGGVNTALRVYEPGGRLVVNTSSSTVVRADFQALIAGTYIVHVQARNLTSLGQYRVGIESISTPSPDSRLLRVGSTLDGHIEGSIQADQYRVSARSGQRFQIDLTPLVGLNSRIRVYDPSGRLTVNTQTSTARTYEFTANMTGNFFVMIEAANGTSLGRYRIGLRLR